LHRAVLSRSGQRSLRQRLAAGEPPRLPALLHGLFLALLVLNLVAGFQVLGTLMAVGVMMLPAVAARCWARTLPGILLLAALMGGFAPGWG
jgi:zinc/manganese transport system permease protein